MKYGLIKISNNVIMGYLNESFKVFYEYRILEQLHQAADHPINAYHPEGEYLKGLILQID